jgi:epoxide hydrolase-like predicted phosphatase
MTIRAVIFDIGGVLVRNVNYTQQRHWEQRLGLPDRALGPTIWSNPVSRLAEIGCASPEEVWADVARRFSLTAEEVASLSKDVFAGSEWDTALIDFARSLRPHYKTGIISNAWPAARQGVRPYVNGDAFDVIVFSAEEGVAKPDRTIFDRALARLGVEPDESIFIDDVEENVQAARSIGLQAMCFESTRQTIDQIKQHLIEG